MSRWRTIFTDSESETGVAPVCESGQHSQASHDIYDCCPHPHIEMASERGAAELVHLLSIYDAEPCS